jgi:NAD(P)-dependent dehydrogenase (short-subunit alcohol dehydrogenase family)
VGVDGSVTDPAALERLVAAALEAHGRIDALVNNTGHPPKGTLLGIPDADWHAGLDVVLLNVVRMARLVTPVMRAQGGGAIVNISTFAAYEPDPAFPLSATLRAALGTFMKLYSDAHAKDGIRMNNLLPGFIDSLPEKEDRRARNPLGRYGRVEEVARTVAFLLSEDAGYITGQNIRIDGGLTRSV